ncbi:MAG: epimerase [Saprospiraceae bacterium]|nr:epimerase [Saprospiraceae bacterium]
MNQKIRAILTGATGMLGEGVLYECLQSDLVESVLIIGRKPYGMTHPKLKELIVKNINELHEIESQIIGYNACFFCLGVSSVGIKEEAFSKLTYDLTLNFAKVLCKLNPDMTFCYISGAGTDSSEKGKIMWARVKGKTENDLRKLPFKAVYNFRPGYMQPTNGLKNTLKYYHYISWMYPMLRMLFPNMVCTLAELGQAMINTVAKGFERPTLEVKEIVSQSKQKL